ncbi:succinate dehydrogenase, cytochrome b556 subunit [Thioalkalivibrio sp. XN8]|uniref:succinate dehydrogenase, cytochrome b556 subunit n=1 Tax=Thioalkalivibrio sp. XN8 TaxID=2712863 RepID=UPI0013EBFF4F|nr:succinate dehydrogenase, cytochrome b556 subunit [Thioalkalivibrio sp. XN8]NGP52827.1 succinate dehydrogenase, cytochrome b556 subunit [Thioalkalivibrio sp. XN8]
MTAGKRPLSPHLQVYRPQITSVLSISHRFTGAVLAVGLLLLVYWLAALAAGEAAYAAALGVLGSWPVRVVLFLGVFAFFYHLCNGIRHLWWDTGRGFEIAQVYRSGWIVLLASATLTLVAWGLLLAGGGA